MHLARHVAAVFLRQVLTLQKSTKTTGYTSRVTLELAFSAQPRWLLDLSTPQSFSEVR